MPLRYKLPAFLGNSLVLFLSVVMIFQGNVILGLLLGGLSALDLFLVYKLDQFSREEVWLTHQLEVAKLREELLAAQKHIAELQGTVPLPSASSVPSIPRPDIEPPGKP